MDIVGGVYGRIRDAQRLGVRFALREASRNKGALFEFKLRNGAQVAIRPNSSDAFIFRQVFRDLQYDLSLWPQDARIDQEAARIVRAGRRPLIIDCGANNGASALWFSLRYPAATVVAVEPDPANSALCEHNTRGRDVQVMRAAIGSRTGAVRMQTEQLDECAYRTLRDDSGDTPVVTIPDIMERYPDHELLLVKVDIEGFESDLFASNTHWMKFPVAIYAEPHDWLLPGQATSRSLLTATAQEDFELLVCGENVVFVRPEARSVA